MKKIEGKYEVVIPNMNPMMDRKIKEAIAKAIRENVDANAVVNYDPNNMTMMTDFYELTMGQVNHKFGEENVIEIFDEFFRENPYHAGYAVFAGLDKIIDYIDHLHFTDEDIDYLRGLGKFTEEYLDYLRHFEFTGDMYVVPDGTPIFKNEPVITVVAPAIECKIIETALLAIVNAHVAYATATRKVINAAGNRPVWDFSPRRAYGPQAANDASKVAVMAGCAGTSNTKVGKDHGVKVGGTQAHCSVMEAKTQKEGFRRYVQTFPDRPTLLVDTYDTLNSGIPDAIAVCEEEGVELGGIRIDSGNLAELTKAAHGVILPKFPNAKICASNALTGEKIEALDEAGGEVDSFGVGENLCAPIDGRLGMVHKLAGIVEAGDVIAKLKVSNTKEKTTNPGFKKIYRFYDKKTGKAIGDVIALNDEVIPRNKYTLVHEGKPITFVNYRVREIHEQIYRGGELVYQEPTMDEKIRYCAEEMNTIYPGVKTHEYLVELSDKLKALKEQLINEARGNVEHEGGQVKAIGEHPQAV